MPLTFAAKGDSRPLFIVDADKLESWSAAQSDHWQAWISASGFKATASEVLVLPGTNGNPEAALIGYGSSQARTRGRFFAGSAVAKLPEGAWHIATEHTHAELEEAALGWLLAGYRFDQYKDHPAPNACLVAPDGVDAERLEAIAAGECLTRDLINTPSNDMGPDELESAARDLANTFGADFSVVSGDDLLAENLPMVHAVGRASPRAPRLIDMTWGDTGPTLTLVGKGVCFDTGGLNLKPGASMGLMKKDMGGSAAVLGLAHMIMAQGLKLRLRVLIPAVENAVSGESYRPGDILTSRKGLTVEINNTDAEGRLVLADALTLADESNPDLIVSMATLTGAARVAVGPDLAPFYTDDDKAANVLAGSAALVADPVWRMPFHAPYETLIEPGIADLDNAPKGGFAGSITAALFLRRFVGETQPYMHFDIYGWQPAAAPARPKGGAGQGTRALFDALPEILGL